MQALFNFGWKRYKVTIKVEEINLKDSWTDNDVIEHYSDMTLAIALPLYFLDSQPRLLENSVNYTAEKESSNLGIHSHR